MKPLTLRRVLLGIVLMTLGYEITACLSPDYLSTGSFITGMVVGAGLWGQRI